MREVVAQPKSDLGFDAEAAVIRGCQFGAPVMNFFLERYTPAYRLELDQFLDCVTAGKRPTPTGEDGLRAQRLADAATAAHQTGQPQRV